MNAVVEAYVGLGANIGDAAAAVEQAIGCLARHENIRLVARSSLYRTPAWGDTDQPDFVNAVARIETSLGAAPLLDVLLRIERDAGRDRARSRRWGPRELDLDLLLYGQARIDTAGLHVPHPHLHERAFVLVPLAEIAPSLDIPGHGRVDALAREMASADIEALR
ncbi:2-amino-4-hydroxy-6-hydroxymethyldihydropteridine diphosphokinase [Cognatilysobacter segetis]|uniref:2-amino-4-hydroxy-6- hydroxymethyldihydropteridine diphosphokinase n=1 Tax=Cognatilysobacter segetis TaxID=2492394 RepID=UPI00105CCA82|nr:2-amino-4-hydroxy-6-hydroxymethyldihydropteridine diphosphokinase [Lysobacter segetis]